MNKYDYVLRTIKFPENIKKSCCSYILILVKLIYQTWQRGHREMPIQLHALFNGHSTHFCFTDIELQKLSNSI